MFNFISSVYRIFPIRSHKYWVEVQYMDDPSIQVLELSAPNLETLKDVIFQRTDAFLGQAQDIQILLITGSQVRDVTVAVTYIQRLIEDSTVEKMVRFQIQSKKSVNLACSPLATSTSTSSASSAMAPSKTFDGFLSYQWGSQDVAKNVHQDLTVKHGLDIWFDLNNMSGPVNRAMAAGIEASKVFIPILTLAYENSRNCLLEIRYANDRSKPMAPIRLMKQGEIASGEAFAITAGLLYADFAGKAYSSVEWNEQMKILVEEITQRKNSLPFAQPSPAPVDPIKAWLNPVDSDVDAERHKRAYVAGTREFYLKAVHEWLLSADVTSSVLWLNGGAGLGKSVIAWLVSQSLPSSFVLGSIFYCRHNDVQKNSPQHLVATTVWNLCNALPSFRQYCEKFQADDAKKTDDSVLKKPQEAFKNIVVNGLYHLDATDKQKNVLLIIDALDECGAPSSTERSDLLELLLLAAKDLPPFIRIFTTGRPEQDVFHTMMKLNTMVLLPNDEENKKDMAVFVEAELLKSFPQGSFSPDDVTAVSAEIFERSSGIFQFARLACNELAQVPASEVLTTVRKFGAGIDGVYDMFFRSSQVRTNNFRLVMKVVLAAKEPITQDVVADLLGVPSHIVGQVLLEIYRILDVSDRGRVKVMHKSLSDHLTSSKRCSDRQFFINIAEANRDIALSCFKILIQQFPSVENTYEALNGTQGFINKNATAQYAFKFWMNHMEDVGADVVAAWSEWKEFASVEKYGPAALCIGIMQKREWLVQHVMDTRNGETLVNMARDLNVFSSAPLYEAARRGLTIACEALIENGRENVNCRENSPRGGLSFAFEKRYGGVGRTPLMIAAQGGYKKTVKSLLKKGADIYLLDPNGKNASSYGCKRTIESWKSQLAANTSRKENLRRSHGQLHLNEWVLHHSSHLLNMDVDDIDEMNPLRIASKNSYEVVKQLVHEGANVNATWREDMSTPLFTASATGHLDGVKLLLQQGASVNVETAAMQTPLHVASQNGHLEVVDWLLQNGGSVNAETKSNSKPLHFAADAETKSGSTPLHFASKYGHLKVVELLLQKGAAVNAIDEDSSTPLHFASYNGHLEVVKLLLCHDACVDVEDKEKCTPLHLASHSGHLEVIKWLLQKDATVNAVTVDRWAPLHFASRSGHLEVVKNLLEHHANVNAQNNFKTAPLHFACKYGHIQVCKWLLLQEATLNAGDKNQWTPLHFASENGRVEIVKWLVQQGAAINAEAEDQEKRTPIGIAFENAHWDAVKWLMQNGATIQAQECKKYSFLHLASRAGQLEVAEWLLQTGLDVNAMVSGKKTSLHLASQNGHLDVVKLLLRNGAMVNAEDENLWTPLHFASSSGHLDLVQELLRQDARVNAHTNKMLTPLHAATLENHLEVVKLLLQNGAPVNAGDKDGKTPLHLASECGHLSVVTWLLQKGANVNAENCEKWTPLHFAAFKRHFAVVKLLVSCGANVFAVTFNGEKPSDMCRNRYGYSDIDVGIFLKSAEDKSHSVTS